MFDEMHIEDGSLPRKAYTELYKWLSTQNYNQLSKKAAVAENIFRRIGITFNVYGNKDDQERLIPFDIIPRIILEEEWRRLEKGIVQRVAAINAFLSDVYNKQEIVKAGIVPSELINHNKAFLPQMCGFKPPGNIYTHIVGIDIVRTAETDFFVLEDNARVPSGVSYMIENRSTMRHMFPELFADNKVKSIADYPKHLYDALAKSSREICDNPTIVVLTPGVHNSAYYEHSFLADEMGVELIQGTDLELDGGNIIINTTAGTQKVDVVYRRIDDEYLDPLSFNPHSLLGSPGIFDAYREKRLMLANAPGSGIADDKAIYSYMPEIVKFYMGDKPILNNIPTWRCSEKSSLSYVIENLRELVVKEVHGSGGYGMLVGPTSSNREIASFKRKLLKNPSNYIAQPTLSLSTVPILTKSGLAPRHVDLRPFVLVSPEGIKVTAGGLTRVALKKGSLVVNSSQGGGTKDTWVLES